MTSELNYFVKMVEGYRSAKILFVANHFNMFTLIEKGCNTVERLREELGTDHRATELLLSALVSLELLRKENEVFSNTSLSKKCLVDGGSLYIGNNLRFQDIIWECWSKLKEVVQCGQPSFILEDLLAEKYPGFLEGYIQGMDDIARGPAEALLKILDVSKARKMLDVGGGPGTYSIALAKANPSLKAVILDLPLVLEVTKRFVLKSNVENQIELLGGNYLTTDFGEEAYDLILMSHITHNEGASTNRLLFNKAYKALRAGGKIAVHDFLIDESKTLPKFAALFAINLLSYTKEGRTYSFGEYKKWMEEQGFLDIQCTPLLLNLDNQTSVMTGKKE